MRYALLSLLLIALPLAAEDCTWPAWERYRQAMMSEDGRIIDRSSAELVTTSEGQSYAMFFALVANDQDSFERLLAWTRNNLADGDLAQQLPAWLWGRNDQSGWGALDSNNATDADLWIAYSLLEAGRLWNRPDYTRLGTEILWRTAAHNLRLVPGLGLMLLPGGQGFESSEGWRFNPSYLPPQLLLRFSEQSSIWSELAANTTRLWLASSPKGLAPDWIEWNRERGIAVPERRVTGSYDSIRVYLWLGMLDPGTPGRSELLEHFSPMTEKTRELQAPPEKLNVLDGTVDGTGPAGFSAALLPWLASTGEDLLLTNQRKRIEQQPPASDAYYSQSLLLFGQGWDEQYYRFDLQGRLIPAWSTSCQ